jgi:hypothetical protein
MFIAAPARYVLAAASDGNHQENGLLVEAISHYGGSGGEPAGASSGYHAS